ncbi:alpha-amylase family glycosyl hydrolase [Dyadobacter sp. CY356]|uniref:alpha-amylase family glycosyl hydrolase n=1 Tax=Dyadobacter sp. CY356 TaxID=2906442 RepID=UPI001F3FAE4D|nr:alpha-amylase family glycosyl hydrolase [Dyadobacter sp. CY356]MCF0054404.1 alpha-amylase [Dyadobacter sp. CY356]
MHPNLPKFIPRVCYEIFVRSFCDSNGDGIGDLNGIISKLDYLADLGIEAIWLTPINPSPSYHKYDPVDHFEIEPEFGTMADFKRLLSEAHKRNIVVYLDLIVNHTSTYHPWFTESSKGPDNPFRHFYWWLSPEKIEELGIAERQTSDDSDEVYPWHEIPGDNEKYYGLFWKGMPDLNYDSDLLRKELAKIITFWLEEIGIDGFRLDAARHIYPIWEKEKNRGFWEFFDDVVRKAKPDAYTVAEVWAETWEVAPYLENLNATFHFDLSFALQRIVIQEKDENLVQQLLASYSQFEAFNPEFIDAIMLTNHDQDRIGSVVGNHKGKIKLAATLLLTLPGQPYIYYGEEIGMLGTKPDPYIREPFLWSENESDSMKTNWLNAEFSTLRTIEPLSSQMKDADSIYSHYKKLIELRKTVKALGQILKPNIEEVESFDNTIMAYVRTHETEPVLIIHNLSSEVKNIRLPDSRAGFQDLIFSTNKSSITQGGELELTAYGSLILKERPTTISGINWSPVV